MITLDDKCNHYKHSPLSFFATSVIAEHYVIWYVIFLSQARSAILAVIPSSSLYTPDLLNARGAWQVWIKMC